MLYTALQNNSLDLQFSNREMFSLVHLVYCVHSHTALQAAVIVKVFYSQNFKDSLKVCFPFIQDNFQFSPAALMKL